jgi:hypothetical protein
MHTTVWCHRVVCNVVKEYKLVVGEFKLPKKWMEAKMSTVNDVDESVKSAKFSFQQFILIHFVLI